MTQANTVLFILYRIGTGRRVPDYVQFIHELRYSRQGPLDGRNVPDVLVKVIVHGLGLRQIIQELRFLSKLPAELPSDVINVRVTAVNPASLFANGLQGMSSRTPNLFRRLYTVALAQIDSGVFQEKTAHLGVAFDT